jgi:hypothetical protein
MMRIYLITNTRSLNPEGGCKVYVGQTEQTLQDRLDWHHWDAKRGTSYVIYCAMRKYGLDAFKIEELATAITQQELNDLEIAFIAKYKSFPYELGYGYNMTSGGDKPPNHKGRKQTPEWIAKRSMFGPKNPSFGKQYRLGAILPESSREAIREKTQVRMDSYTPEQRKETTAAGRTRIAELRAQGIKCGGPVVGSTRAKEAQQKANAYWTPERRAAKAEAMKIENARRKEVKEGVSL